MKQTKKKKKSVNLLTDNLKVPGLLKKKKKVESIPKHSKIDTRPHTSKGSFS